MDSCLNCRYCQSLGSPLPNILEPYNCRCLRNNGLVTLSNHCKWYEKLEGSCEGCVHLQSSGIGSFCEKFHLDEGRCCEYLVDKSEL